MKLAQLFSIFTQLKWGESANSDVLNITSDSRAVQSGSVFVAVKGIKSDGHSFLRQVCAQGAIAVVVENDSLVPKDFAGSIVKVENARAVLSQLASRYYKEPAQAMVCIGLTGTNGKTTTTHMIEAILDHYGWPTGVMGTIDHHLKDKVWNTEHTTSDPVVFQRRLADFVALGAKAVTVEVSSHALKQNRVEGVPFDIVGFTNLTRDHLDYHETMEDYFNSKQMLFNELIRKSNKQHKFAIINKDDEYGKKLHVADGVKKWTYGQKDCDFSFRIISQSFSGTDIELQTPRDSAKMHVTIPGVMNVYNATCATAVAMAAGVSLEKCVEAMQNFAGVKGRLERIFNNKGLNVFVDFAHSPDALDGILSTLQRIMEGVEQRSRIITIFGCGGDRDKGKRPMMGKIAFEKSDLVFVTSDNPRSENPQDILADIVAGMPSAELDKKFFVEVDRKKAISRAITMAKPDDVILIAGKGHEEYQEIKGVKHPFSDVAVAKEILQ
jgi:UDP-N-acetylmuramoyl-L-alanyl-D-glutamate--2,6-diaminopimelate ligase